MHLNLTRRQALALLAGQSSLAAPYVGAVVSASEQADAPPFPATQAEIKTGVAVTNKSIAPYPINPLRYGIVPNKPEAAAANTAILVALLSPAVRGPTGHLVFLNTTGADTYFFSGAIPCRDGTHIDAQGSTLNFSGTASAADAASGCFFALRDFSFRNGKVVVRGANGSAYGAWYAFRFGARGMDSSYFPKVYDSLLATPLGNCHVADTRIDVLNTGSNMSDSGAIAMIGGLQGCSFKNVFIDGNGVLAFGIVYEFGWATNEPNESARQTSHANALQFENCSIRNLNPTIGVGLSITGAYNFNVDGLECSGMQQAIGVIAGESLFYRPWAGVNQTGAKRQAKISRVIGQAISAGMSLDGTGHAAATYLAPVIAALPSAEQSAAQTDLYEFLVDSCVMDGGTATSTKSSGLMCSGGKLDVRNSRFANLGLGIRLTDECTRFTIESSECLKNWASGMNLDAGYHIWKSARQKVGTISNCFVAGNSIAKPGASPGLVIGQCASARVMANRFGYELSHDGFVETTQGNHIQVSATASNVVCEGNYCATPSSGSHSYASASTSMVNGNRIVEPAGDASVRGAWGDGITDEVALAYSSSMTIDASQGSDFIVTLTDGKAHSFNSPLNPKWQSITLTIRNASGGSAGTAAFNPIFKMAPWTQPANGGSRSIRFRYNGSHYVETARSMVDVPN